MRQATLVFSREVRRMSQTYYIDEVKEAIAPKAAQREAHEVSVHRCKGGI